MGIVYYGTKVFKKNKGYYGEAEECIFCHRVYEKQFVKYNVWAHVDFIPLIPVKTRYIKMCPICGYSEEFKSKEAKPMMVNKSGNQNIKLYAKHILANKPKSILDADESYELWARDMNSGEEYIVLSDTSKGAVKEEYKRRGLKKLEIVTIK